MSEESRLAEMERYGILDTPADGAFDDITALAGRYFDVPIAIVSLVDRDRVWFKSSFGLSGVEQIDRGPGLCASAIMRDTVHVAPDLREDPESLTNPLVAADNGFRFYAAAPLKSSRGFNLGTICVIDTVPRAFSASDAEDLGRFSRLVMAQIEMRLSSREVARLANEISEKNHQLEKLARSDPLTGLSNRRAIQHRLDRLCSRDDARRDGAIVLFDIDHFKRINDTHGHQAGDHTLVEVTRRIRDVLRPDDGFGRFGGEEFLVVLEDHTAEAAARVAEDIRSIVDRSPIEFGARSIRVTISGGLAVADRGVPAFELIRRADEALYAAKRSGRNRIVRHAEIGLEGRSS